MNYNFNVEIATRIGVDEAIMLNNFVYWLLKNKANNKNFFDGNYWTFNSVRAYSELFPFWNETQIRRILKSLIDFFIDEVSKDKLIYWPVHPRTAKKIEDIQYWDKLLNHSNFCMLHPLGYHELLKMNTKTDVILTDSGGLQEECTVLGTPCLTLRWNTERPITLVENGGVSTLVGNNIEKIKAEYFATLNKTRIPKEPELWDGNTAARCLKEILNFKEA